MRTATFEKIIDGIKEERQYQDNKWGTIDTKPHQLPAWLLIMKKELIEAEDAWMKKTNEEVLCEILQVIATGVACLEQHGVITRPDLNAERFHLLDRDYS